MVATIICAPAAPQILAEFHTENQSYKTLIVSIWELGEVLGPLMIAPLSELYGRFYVYHAGNILFVIFSTGCALSTNIHMLLAFRFLNGLALVSVTLNSSIVGDLFPVEQRGVAMALVGLIPFLGPVTGPLIGSYLGNAAGWRWTFWLVTIASGACELLFLPVFRETYNVQIVEEKATQLRKETGNPNLRSKYATGETASVVGL
jgi:MFS family permease